MTSRDFCKYSFGLMSLFAIIFLVCGTAYGDKKSEPEYITAGLEFFRKGEYPRAIEYFKQAVELNPNSEIGHLNLGMSYFKLGSYETSIEALQTALQLNPKSSASQLFMGLSYLGLGKYSESIPYFENTKKLNPGFEQTALFNIAQAHQKMGNTVESNQYLTQVIDADPQNSMAEQAKEIIKSRTNQKEEKKPWSISVYGGIEYDENVSASDLDLNTQEGDISAVYELSGSYAWKLTKKDELQLGYKFSEALYRDFPAFDLQMHMASLNGSHKFENFSSSMSYMYTRASLGREDLLEMHRFTPTVGRLFYSKFYPSISYIYTIKNFFTAQDRDAQNHGVSLDNLYFFMNNKAYVLMGYLFESEGAKGNRFDYLGHNFKGQLKMPLPIPSLETELNFSYSYSFRDFLNVTPSIGEEREEKKHYYAVKLIQPVLKIFRIQLEYEYTDSKSNLDSSDFTENKATIYLGVEF
jgi:tetratricopeptide (TPR) repeat protein